MEKSEDLKTNFIAQIPKLAYRFIPKDDLVINFNAKDHTKSIRKVFESTNPANFYLEHETEQLKRFEKEFLGKLDKISASDKLKFLQATKFDIAKAFESLHKHNAWQIQKLPISYSSTIHEILNNGFIYVQGRDINFKPIIVINVEVYISNREKYHFSEWNSAAIYLLEYVKNYLLIPGQIEEWVIISNMTNCSLLTFPDELKGFSGEMQENYRCRLSKLYIVGLSFVMRFLLKMLMSFLEETTQKKFRVLGNNNELLESINSSILENCFGGSTKIASRKFPPEFDSSLEDHGCMRESTKQFLCDEDTYKSMISANKIVQPDPDCLSDELD